MFEYAYYFNPTFGREIPRFFYGIRSTPTPYITINNVQQNIYISPKHWNITPTFAFWARVSAYTADNRKASAIILYDRFR